MLYDCTLMEEKKKSYQAAGTGVRRNSYSATRSRASPGIESSGTCIQLLEFVSAAG